MRSFLVFVLTFFSVFCLVASYTITIPPSVKECFFEELHQDDKMTVTFQVGDGGHLDVDFWVIILLISHLLELVSIVALPGDGRCYKN